MRGRKEFAILFFIIAVLVFYIFSEKGEKTHYEMPVIEKFSTDDISKLVIKKNDSVIELIKEGGKWLVGPHKYPADESIVNRMIDKVSTINLTALASESKNYAIYELDENNRIDVEAYKGEDLVRKVSIGKPASSYRHTFVMINDDYRVFHAKGNIRSDFDKTVSGLRDRKVMAFTDDINEVVLKKGEEEITIVRETAPVSVDVTKKEDKEAEQQEAGPKWVTADGKAVRKSEVEGIINTLSNFMCDEFIEDKTKEDFKSPIFTVTLRGVKTYTISIFEKKDNKYPAVSSESDYPFLISKWKADQIMKDFESLVEEKK